MKKNKLIKHDIKGFKYIKKEQSFKVNKFSFTKNLYLIIPFIIMSSLLVIIPLVVIIINVINPNNGSIEDIWGIMTGTIWQKIGNSFWIAVVSTIISLIISFPFAYFLSNGKNKIFKLITIMLITGPIWINILIKLIGLKTILDLLNNEINSTYGHFYTIIGLVYMYTPIMILPIYNSLQTLPKNLINASKDLGRGNLYTFFAIVVPWCKTALISAVILVLLPCFTTVAIPSFLNNSNDGGLIGDTIINQGNNGLSNNIALARTSILVLIVSGIMLAIYISIVWLPNWIKLLILKTAKAKNAK